MAVTINSNGTITGIAVGGLPDGVVDAGTLATNSVDSAELIDGAVDNSHLATGITSSKLSGNLPALNGSALTALSAANLTGNLPAISGSSLTGVYNVDSLGANSHSKMIASTYDLSTASGNKDITGFGFDPKIVFMFWGQSVSVNWGIGFMQVNQNVGYGIRNTGGSTTGLVDQEGSLLAHKQTGNTHAQNGILSSITDGIRIAFTKVGSPTGSLHIKVLGFK
jgi:hypothetical protein